MPSAPEPSPASLDLSVPTVPELSVERRTPVAGRLATVVGVHAVVDFFSAIIIPLLSVIEGRLSLTPEQGALLLAIGSLSSGLVQPAIALFSDRYNTRAVAWIGLLAAVLSVTLVGHATTFGQMLAIQVVATAGIGAFHPPAAAMVGELSGSRRAAGVSVFFVSGMIGITAGMLTIPAWAERFGIESLTWLIAPGIVATVVLAFACRGRSHSLHHARAAHEALDASERGARWRSIWILYVTSIVRYTVNMALMHLLIRWAEARVMLVAGENELSPALRHAAAQTNGPVQAAMQVGMAAGGLFLASHVKPGRERGPMVWVPMAGAVVIVLFPFVTNSIDVSAKRATLLVTAGAVAFAMGIGYAGMVPTTIALAQRLLPHRTNLASSLMLGGSWFIAALGPIGAQAVLDRFGLSTAFIATAALLAIAAVLSVALDHGLLAKLAERREHGRG